MKMLGFVLLLSLVFPAQASSVDWSAALKGVAFGETHWLEQVPALAAVADVKQARALEDALTVALVSNTRAALKALRQIDAGKWPHMIGTNIVCTPMTEKSPEEMITFYQHMRQALLQTSDGAMCLWTLEAAMAEINAVNARQNKKS